MTACAKVVVTCELVTPEGRTFRGTNAVRNPQRVCPREPGEGYGPCLHVCRQEDHAEIMALKAAREWAVGATAYVTFHRERPGHVCDPCRLALERAGVVAVHLVQYRAPRPYPIAHPLVDTGDK